MKSKANAYNEIQKLLSQLNRSELAALVDNIRVVEATAPEPVNDGLLPGEYYEERVDQRGGKVRHYLYKRWYARQGADLLHKGRLVYKGTKAEYLAQLNAA